MGTQANNRGRGGAIACEVGSAPAFTDCLLSQNTSVENGGAVWCRDGSGPSLTRSTIAGNQAGRVGGPVSGPSGGGVYCELSAPPSVVDCTFTGNAAVQGFQGNPSGGGALMFNVASPVITRSSFEGNSGANGGAIWCAGIASPQIADCTFSGNSAGFGGAVNTSSPAGGIPSFLTHCAFTDNIGGFGGALYCAYTFGDTLEVTYSILAGNQAPLIGGGIYSGSGATVHFTRCTFHGNAADSGAAVGLTNSTVLIDHSILAFGPRGQAVYCDGGDAVLACTDIYGHAGGDWVGASPISTASTAASPPIPCSVRRRRATSLSPRLRRARPPTARRGAA